MPKTSPLQRAIKPVKATIDSKRTVCEAVTQMQGVDASAILVLNSKSDAVGLLSQRDLLSIAAAGLDPHSVRVEQVLREEFVTIPRQTTPEEAIYLMLEQCLDEVLVSEQEKVYGLVSMSEVTRLLLEDRDARIRNLTFYITHD